MDEILTPEHWNELQLRLKQKYPEIADTDLQYHEAGEEDVLKMVEYLLQMKKEETQPVTFMAQSFFSFERLLAL